VLHASISVIWNVRFTLGWDELRLARLTLLDGKIQRPVVMLNCHGLEWDGFCQMKLEYTRLCLVKPSQATPYLILHFTTCNTHNLISIFIAFQCSYSVGHTSIPGSYCVSYIVTLTCTYIKQYLIFHLWLEQASLTCACSTPHLSCGMHYPHFTLK